MMAEQAFVGTFEGCDGLAAAMAVPDQGVNLADHKVDVRQSTFAPWRLHSSAQRGRIEAGDPRPLEQRRWLDTTT